MTGLDSTKDHLLEIAVLITNGNLDIVDANGMNFIIKTDKQILDTMSPWCIKQHGDVSRRTPPTGMEMLITTFIHLSVRSYSCMSFISL